MNGMNQPDIPIEDIVKRRDSKSVFTFYKQFFEEAKKRLLREGTTLNEDEIFSHLMPGIVYRIYILGFEDGFEKGFEDGKGKMNLCNMCGETYDLPEVTYDGFTGKLKMMDKRKKRKFFGVDSFYKITIYNAKQRATRTFANVKLEDIKFHSGYPPAL